MTFWNNIYRATCPLCGRRISKTNLNTHYEACKRKKEQKEQKEKQA
jgi:reverse gyrase